jgi:hypothetical protein
VTELDVQTLVDDEGARKALDAAFLKMYRQLFKLALDEGMWGPAHETLSQVRKSFAPHFERISEEKRKK